MEDSKNISIRMEHKVETKDNVQVKTFKMKFSGVPDAKSLELIEFLKNRLYKVEEDNYGAKDNLKDNKVNLRKEETSLFCDIQTLLTDIGKRKRPSAESADSTSNSNISENQVKNFKPIITSTPCLRRNNVEVEYENSVKRRRK